MTAAKLAIGGAVDDVKTRLGVSELTRMAFAGVDLGELWNDLLEATSLMPGNTAATMDLSVVAQLLGDPQSGAILQDGALAIERLYRCATAAGTPKLRLLALAGATDIGGNVPIGFLVQDSDVELLTLYIVPGKPLPDPLPEHDVAIVILGNSNSMAATLDVMTDLVPAWPRPILNDPRHIVRLQRDSFAEMLRGAPGIVVPQSARVERSELEALPKGDIGLDALLPDAGFPIIVRPVDSHAGRGLEKISSVSELKVYLKEHLEPEFFVSPFVDYSGPDGLHRKYRIVFIDGRPFACHMAIAEDWKVWYLNAQMELSEVKREEESRFMAEFDTDFAARHAAAFEALAERVDLDYFGIDCAETRDGKLLVFEGETALIVHDMDPPEIYPYKVGQMRKLFGAFVAMLHRRSKSRQTEAA